MHSPTASVFECVGDGVILTLLVLEHHAAHVHVGVEESRS